LIDLKLKEPFKWGKNEALRSGLVLFVESAEPSKDPAESQKSHGLAFVFMTS
jgi:hypothetical protein